MKVNSQGLVALKMLKSSAANGIRKGEVRGMPPAIAENLVKKGYAEVHEKAKKKAAKPAKNENNEQKPGGSPAGTAA